MASNPKKGFADKKMIGRAISDSFIKLNPKTQAQNPVMLLVYISAILTTILWIIALCGLKDASAGYTLAIAIILWFTVLFANFAEARHRPTLCARQKKMWKPIKYRQQTKRMQSQWYLPQL